MKHASLFSGIGGFDLAAQWMGWENVLSCEFDPFCQSVLRHHFPTTTHYGDIRELDGTPYRGKIDILTGGFPCQPFSAAGKRRGTEDNRFLWPEMLRVIREIQPTWIVAENVRGIVSIEGGLVFERVCSEMEANGYEVQPFCIPACAVGAPHRRDRMWFIAHHNNAGSGTPNGGADGEREAGNKGWEGFPQHWASRQYSPITDGSRIKCEWRECEGSIGRQPETPIGNGNSDDSRWGRESWLQAATRLCRVDDGVSRELDGITIPKWRRQSLKAYGNAIVPQIAYRIFQSLALCQ